MQTGVVVIGRNEGERLHRCLESVKSLDRTIVYVDSGSQDDSVELARNFGAAIVELDSSASYTAGRARNAGFVKLKRHEPDLSAVQFVDGDCEIAQGWIEKGLALLSNTTDIGIVAGRVRERDPAQSIYNRLCDMEWSIPPGEIDACGGIMLMRAEAFTASGGFREDLIAGEEPELCLRLRRAGWRIRRIDADMAWHDAAMTRFGQWWRRAMRSGHAYAEGYALHGHGPERFDARQVVSVLGWAGVLPAAILVLSVVATPWALLLLLGYPVLAWRIGRYRRRLGDSTGRAMLYAGFCVLGKFAELAGMMRFWTGRLRNRKPELIEYKGRFPDHP